VSNYRKFNRGINSSSFKALYGHEAYNGLEIVNNLTSDQKKGIKTSQELFSVLGDEARLEEIVDDDDEDQEVTVVVSKDLVDIANSLRGKKRPASEQESEPESEQEREQDKEEEARKSKVAAIEKARAKANKGQAKQAVDMLKLNRKHIASLKVYLKLHLY